MSEEKKGIVLALSSSRRSRETIKTALDLAETEGAGIFLLYVMEDEVPNKIAEYVSEKGFMGEKTSAILKKSLLQEYRERGTEEIESLTRICRDRSIPIEKQFCSGKFSEEVIKIMEKMRPETIVLNKREDRSDLERWVFGSEVEKIKKKATCVVRVVKGC